MTQPDLLEFENSRSELSEHDLLEWLDTLHQADQTFHDMMSLEIWSVTQTVDTLVPGFWSRYMANRQAIVQQYLEERRRRSLRHSSHKNLNSIVEGCAAPQHFGSPFTAAIPDEPQTLTSHFASDFESELLQLSRWAQAADKPEPPPTDPPEAVAQPSIDSTEFRANDQPLPDLRSAMDVARENSIAHADPVQHPLFSASALTVLSHLVKGPTIKAFSQSASEIDPFGLIRLAIACWLTPQFWTLSSRQDSTFSLQQTDCFHLKPGQTVICGLGFQLSGISSPVKVMLARSLRREDQLSATWMADLPQVPPSLRRQIKAECAVQLYNRGDCPFLLQAGMPFCRLEFFWANPLAPSYEWNLSYEV